MKLKHKLIATIATLFIFIFPEPVTADTVTRLYHFSYTDYGREYLDYTEFKFYSRFLPEEQAFIMFYTLFGNYSDYYFVPSDVRIIDVHELRGNLYLNVSGDIKNYNMSSSYELRLAAQIIKTALSIEGIDTVTLLIHGFEEHLPKGTFINPSVQISKKSI